MDENKEQKANEEVKKDEKVETKENVTENKENKTDEKKENSFDKEKLKSETSNTVNQVKDTIKNVNIKEDSLEAKNFVKEMFIKPVDKIKEVVEDNTGKTFKYAIIIIAIWTIVSVLKKCFGGVFSLPGGEAILGLLKSLITPILGILVISIIILMLSKENKKTLTTIITSVTIANIPIIISAIIGMLNFISTSAYKIISPISSFCLVITTVLLYFSIKYLFNKKDSEAIKTFVLVEGLYFIVSFVLSFLGIYI